MLHAVLLAIAADGLLALMDAIVKTMTVRYSTFQIAFLRFGFGFAWASLLLVCFRPGLPSRETIVFNTTRSVLAVITATSFFYALSQLPLADGSRWRSCRRCSRLCSEHFSSASGSMREL